MTGLSGGPTARAIPAWAAGPGFEAPGEERAEGPLDSFERTALSTKSNGQSRRRFTTTPPKPVILSEAVRALCERRGGPSLRLLQVHAP